MSNEENQVEETAAAQDDAGQNDAPASAESVAETAKAETEATAAGAQAVNNLIASALELKEKNPKVFFGAIGGVVLLLIIMMSMGGSEPTVKGQQEMKPLVKGNKYVLKSVNSYESKATVRLVSSPDNIAAYDDTEEADRSSPCQHIPQGTPVTVTELLDMYGTKNAYAKVQMEEGDCKGKDGWVSSINVQ